MSTLNFFVRCRQEGFTRIKKFFKEFFTGTKAGEYDGHIILRCSGQTDESARQIGDTNRLSHVQHQDVTVGSKRKRLEDKRNCLGDGHEKAGNLRMCNCDTALVADLLLENRYDTPLRAEHIPKPDGSTLHSRRTLCQYKFPNSLGCTHYTARVHCLIGRYQE